MDSSPLFVSPSETLLYLNSFEPLKAAGPDNVSPFLLKKCSHILAEPLSSLLSRCLQERKLPDCWRAVKITPIPKKDSDKFRPIACTSVLLKLLETFIPSKLCTFLPNLDSSQFAYRPKYSTINAVASLVHFFVSSLDKKNKFVRLCFLDLSNTLDGNTLCSLLHLKEVPSSILSWLSDYFLDRKQFVVHGGKCSSLLTNNSGVLQSAILSPFLISFYISDMPYPDCLTLFEYADDISLGCASSSCSDVDLQRGLDLIVDWTTERALSINSSKSFDVCFSLSSLDKHIVLASSLFSLSINENAIPQAQKFKYLGVYLSYNLKWSDHISFVFTKVCKISFYVKGLRSFSTPHFLIDRFVFCCILPFILYCSPVVFCGLLSKDWKIIPRCS